MSYELFPRVSGGGGQDGRLWGGPGWWVSEEDGTLYPPGYTELPIITEGKLEVEPELEEERKWWQLW